MRDDLRHSNTWNCDQAPTIKPTTANLRTYTGEAIKVVGAIEVDVEYYKPKFCRARQVPFDIPQQQREDISIPPCQYRVSRASGTSVYRGHEEVANILFTKTRISKFLFWYRLTPHSTTGVPPSELRVPRFLLDLQSLNKSTTEAESAEV